jgi:RHS repeat-associated protein
LEWAASYLYDIDNYRVSKTNRDELTTDFVFDLNGKILEEISGDTTIQYVFIKERHLARVEDDETLFYGTDHVNSPVLMTDAEGNTVWSGDVSPFGDYTVIDSDEYEELALKFTGKDMDEDVGLYYFNARWYDAETGRFITEDPIRDGLNWYGYVSNNPLRFIDPTGLMTDEHRDEYSKLEAGGASTEELQNARDGFEQQERDFIDMNLFFLGVSNISDEERKTLKATSFEYMGYYNRDIVPDSVEDYGGEIITGNFEESNPYTDLGQDPHSGLDFIGGDGLETQWYTIYEKSLDQSSNPIILSVPGTDYVIRVKHGDSTPIQKMDKGEVFTPTEKIIPFPIKSNPKQYLPHFHVEIGTTDSYAMSPLVHPIGLGSGSFLDYFFDYSGVKGIAPMSYSWIK